MLALYLSVLDDPADEAIFTSVYQEFNTKMYWVAFRILHSDALAQDSLAEAWIKVAKQFKKFLSIPRRENAAWLVIVVEHAAFDLLRKEKKYTNLSEHEFLPVPPARERAEEGANYHALIDYINHLPDIYLEIMQLKFVLEYSDQEIARQTGLPLGTVTARISRGRSILKKILLEEGYVCD